MWQVQKDLATDKLHAKKLFVNTFGLLQLDTVSNDLCLPHRTLEETKMVKTTRFSHCQQHLQSKKWSHYTGEK